MEIPLLVEAGIPIRFAVTGFADNHSHGRLLVTELSGNSDILAN
jgi:hypothetical protein